MGEEDILPLFIKRGYWYCWDINNKPINALAAPNSIPNQQERFRQIAPGDRIAIKRLLGKGSSNMAILAIGIVKDVDLQEWRVYVDWIRTDIKGRHVPLAGCIASIHGPYTKATGKDEWLNEIFSL